MIRYARLKNIAVRNTKSSSLSLRDPWPTDSLLYSANPSLVAVLDFLPLQARHCPDTVPSASPGTVPSRQWPQVGRQAGHKLDVLDTSGSFRWTLLTLSSHNLNQDTALQFCVHIISLLWIHTVFVFLLVKHRPLSAHNFTLVSLRFDR